MKRTIVSFRNPIASVWQHAIHKAVSQKSPKASEGLSAAQPEMVQFSSALDALQNGQAVPQLDTTGLPIGDCAKLAAQYAWAEIRHAAAEAAQIQDQLRYGTCDPLWSIALAIYLAWKATLKSVPYVRYADLGDFVTPLPEEPDLVIGIIADWGTGLDDAKWLLSEVMTKNPHVLIHLGDIYYAGMPDEVRTNFLDIVNAAASNIPVYTMSGNHDMYSGGDAFYWLIGQLNSAPNLQEYKQKASYFCLRSSNWQILGMDTGLHDCDPTTVTTNTTYLDSEEAAWLRDKLDNAGTRQTILLSHHQLFTAFGDGVGKTGAGKSYAYNPKLYSVFQPYLDKVALWLWGHEHNFDFFKPYLGLKKGRCVGASAIPSLVSQNPYGLISNPELQDQNSLPELDPTLLKLGVTADGAYFHNYAIVTLRSPKSQIKDSKIEYYQLDSCKHGKSQLMGGEVIP
jgi:calcineurin-like phosphoesterase family protein